MYKHSSTSEKDDSSTGDPCCGEGRCLCGRHASCMCDSHENLENNSCGCNPDCTCCDTECFCDGECPCDAPTKVSEKIRTVSPASTL